jgi:hypothetical protein
VIIGYNQLFDRSEKEGRDSRPPPSLIWTLLDVADKPATKTAQQHHRRGIDLAWWDPSAV